MQQPTGTPWIAIIGDRRECFEPQDAIEPAIAHAANRLGIARLDARWIATEALDSTRGGERLIGAAGVWCAPGSPFKSLEGALEGIRYAREHRVPFLGTCAGFQHAVLEFARNVLGHAGAAHAEYTEPAADRPGPDDLFIDELLCSLVGQTMRVRLVDEELVAVYGTAAPTERYYCRFGLNPRWRDQLHARGLAVAGVDERDGDVRLLRLAGHPFYVLTLFVPQTSSQLGAPHPLITRFVAAVTAGTGEAIIR